MCYQTIKIYLSDEQILKLIRPNVKYTPGTAGGPGGRDRMLSVKSRKNAQNYFAHGRFPEEVQKQKTEKKKKVRAEVGDNNGQATRGARNYAWRTQAAWAKKLKTQI